MDVDDHHTYEDGYRAGAAEMKKRALGVCTVPGNGWPQDHVVAHIKSEIAKLSEEPGSAQ